MEVWKDPLLPRSPRVLSLLNQATGPAGMTDQETPGSAPSTAPLRTRLRARALAIAGAYAVVASLWILFSDAALAWVVPDPERLVRWSVFKGIAFVAVTSVLLLVLIRRAFRSIEAGYQSLNRKEQQRRAAQGEAERLGRLYAALSQVNQAIVRTATAEALFERVCQGLVESGGFLTAWVGRHDATAHRIVPVARSGHDDGYLDSVRIFTDDRPEGRGPSGIAFRSGTPYICNDISADASTTQWREEAGRRGYRASGSFPIRTGGEVIGLLNVYADEVGFFREREVHLLTEVANDVSFALDNLERERAHRSAEAAAARERQFADTMIESLPGILYLYSTEGQFLRWNDNFERVSGYAADEIAVMHPLDFFADEHKPLLEHRIAEVFEQGEAFVEAPFLTKDGRSVPYFFTGRRIVFEERDCLVGVGIDVSERHEAEEALRELNQTLERRVVDRTAELEEAKVRAEAADRLKSAFLATMSHELRTPLNSIIGFTGIVLQELAGPLTEEQAKQLGMVRSSARHLLDLITDVLDLSKIEAGQLDVRREPFDLDAVIEHVTETVRPLADAKGLHLRVESASSLGRMVSDRRRVEQVLLNLLNNGIKFTDRGGVTLLAEQSNGRVHLAVRDTGIGIELDDQPQLFQPFRQIDSGLTRQHEGTGLGLAICRRLATLMGGDITVVSEPGRGSEFRVTLPVEAPAPENAAHHA